MMAVLRCVQVGTKWQNWSLAGSMVVFTAVLVPLTESYKRMDVDEADRADEAGRASRAINPGNAHYA